MSKMSFAELKKRQRSTTAEDLKNKLAKDSKNNEVDNRFWKPTMKKLDKPDGDVVGLSSDIIRLLPESDADIRLVSEGKYSEAYLCEIFHRQHHAFQGPNGWFFEESRAMLLDDTGSNLECPVFKKIKPMWDEAKETDNKTRMNKIKEYFTKQEYIVNILVIKDGSNPENNGKVFLFRLTKAMMDKINSCYSSKFEGDEEFNPFDVKTGKNFLLNLEYKVKSFGNYTGPVADYANAKFANTSTPLADTDEGIDEIMAKAHSFFSYLDKVKSEDELTAKLDKVFSYKSNTEHGSAESDKHYEQQESKDTNVEAVSKAELDEYEALLNS